MIDPVTGDLIKESVKALVPVLKPVVADVIGLLGGDKLHERRLKNVANVTKEAGEHLERRNVENPEDPTPSIAILIMQAAADEERAELVDLFARLLAAAMDPNRKDSVRKDFIEIVRQLDSIDALVLQSVYTHALSPGTQHESVSVQLGRRLQKEQDDVAVSLERLGKRGLVYYDGSTNRCGAVPLGNVFMRVVRD